jgi:hypothetical protein
VKCENAVSEMTLDMPRLKSKRSYSVFISLSIITLLLGIASSAHAVLGILGDGDKKEYDMVASSQPWDAAPARNCRLFLDVYNTSDYYDSEPNGDPRFSDRTVLSDTVRPVTTVLWDRYRFQVGLIAQRNFGTQPAISSIDPWVQLMWKPTQNFVAIMGNLDIPHQYMAPVFYAQNYFLISGQNTEKGLQLLHNGKDWTDDLFFNYRQTETATQQEKLDFGFVHHNDYRLPSDLILHLTYQAHWTHTGGDNYPHLINTINDSAQAWGVGLKRQLGSSVIVGGNFSYLHSHYRTDSSSAPLSETIQGDGRYTQLFVRYGRIKVVYGSWRGSNFSHEEGDEYFRASVMRLGIIHWDILLGNDFNLFAEAVGYFIGNNDVGYSHFVKPTFTIQAAWHFAVPSLGWNLGNSPETWPPPDRWDTGL